MSAIAHDLPANVVQTLREDSLPSSMDFHPVSHTVLLGWLLEYAFFFCLTIVSFLIYFDELDNQKSKQLIYSYCYVSSVGTDVGTIGLWDVNSGKKLFSRNFRVWDIEACCTNFKVCPLPD